MTNMTDTDNTPDPIAGAHAVIAENLATVAAEVIELVPLASRSLAALLGRQAHPSEQTPDGALPITRAPALTRDVSSLLPWADLRVDADRIGFHVEPGLAGRERKDYLTIAPTIAGLPIVLIHMPDDHAVRVLDVVTAAIADNLAGDLLLHVGAYRSGGWFVTSAIYTDSEGERHA